MNDLHESHEVDFDFTFAPGAPRRQLQKLTSLAFIEQRENILLCQIRSLLVQLTA